MGGVIISRKRDGRSVCVSWSDEWYHRATIRLGRGLYAHFCAAIDDDCDPECGRFEWNITTCDDTVSDDECRWAEARLPRDASGIICGAPDNPPLTILDAITIALGLGPVTYRPCRGW